MDSVRELVAGELYVHPEYPRRVIEVIRLANGSFMGRVERLDAAGAVRIIGLSDFDARRMRVWSY